MATNRNRSKAELAEEVVQAEPVAETEHAEPVAEAEQAIYIKYVGPAHEFVPGAPMRDLTYEEWQALRNDVQGLAIVCGIYKVVGFLPDDQSAERGE